MQDRFKFRFYDKDKKIMIKPSPEMSDIEWKNVCTTYGNDEWWWCVEAAMPTIFEYFDTNEYSKKNFIIMQCTGLKDKNGKLIYEGDVVNMQHWKTPREVIYINGAYCGWYMKQIKEEKGCTGKDCLTFSSEHIGKAEVIGNIYENKELIEREAK